MHLKETVEQSVAQLKEAGIATPELDTQVIVCHILKKDNAFLLTHPEYEVKIPELVKIKKAILRRRKNEPVAYITGHKEFFGYDFLVSKDVLIPRPESEFLVEQALEDITCRLSKFEPKFDNHESIIKILDLGTGSGCIIIALAKELEKIGVIARNEVTKQSGIAALQGSIARNDKLVLYAVDISQKALKVAKKNAHRLFYSSNDREKFRKNPSSRQGSNNKINFILSDLFSNPKFPQKFDLIIANLPYVPNSQQTVSSKQSPPFQEPVLSLPKEGVRGGCPDIKFEPQNAIFAEDNGTATIKKFLDQANDRLNENGLILIELDPRNAKELKAFAKHVFPRAKIQLIKDLAERNRYLKIRF